MAQIPVLLVHKLALDIVKPVPDHYMDNFSIERSGGSSTSLTVIPVNLDGRNLTTELNIGFNTSVTGLTISNASLWTNHTGIWAIYET